MPQLVSAFRQEMVKEASKQAVHVLGAQVSLNGPLELHKSVFTAPKGELDGKGEQHLFLAECVKAMLEIELVMQRKPQMGAQEVADVSSRLQALKLRVSKRMRALRLSAEKHADLPTAIEFCMDRDDTDLAAGEVEDYLKACQRKKKRQAERQAAKTPSPVPSAPSRGGFGRGGGRKVQRTNTKPKGYWISLDQAKDLGLK